jgi:hypothetical protein
MPNMGRDWTVIRVVVVEEKAGARAGKRFAVSAGRKGWGSRGSYPLADIIWDMPL